MMIQSDRPRKVYVELTTRCNLQCAMCVKHTAGSCIPDDDMDLAVFRKLLPSLAGIDTLVLNGIGESLLHPDLMEIIRLADIHMAKSAVIGLQSNGVLVDRTMARELVERGLNTLCLSVDGFDDPLRGIGARQHSFKVIGDAVRHMGAARKNANGSFLLGLEAVLSRKRVGDLPDLVDWAAANGVDYLIASHLMPYDRDTETTTLFNPHSNEAVRLYDKYCEKAAGLGLDFVREFRRSRKSAGTRTEPDFANLLISFFDEARKDDMRLNLDHINPFSSDAVAEITRVFERAKQCAGRAGLDLQLPPLYAFRQRECRFLTEHATFISTNGDVMPCHFLWHTYPGRLLREDIRVEKRVFGTIRRDPLENIWLSKPYRDFRAEAQRYDYANCHTCPQGPCTSLINDDSGYANDCFGSRVPCSHCQWNLGGIRCL